MFVIRRMQVHRYSMGVWIYYTGWRWARDYADAMQFQTQAEAARTQALVGGEVYETD